MSFPKYLIDACEEIDAAVFSGDVMWQDESREKLAIYVDRWKRALEAHVAALNEDETKVDGDVV